MLNDMPSVICMRCPLAPQNTSVWQAMHRYMYQKKKSITLLLQMQVSWLSLSAETHQSFKQTLCAIFLVVYSEDHNMLRLQPKLKRHMGMLSLSCDCSLTSGVQANCSAASQRVHPSLCPSPPCATPRACRLRLKPSQQPSWWMSSLPPIWLPSTHCVTNNQKTGQVMSSRCSRLSVA